MIDAQWVFGPLRNWGRLGLAVSGGPDSLGLLLLAHDFAEQARAHERFIVYSVDHGLRPEATDEVQFVLHTARRLGFSARGLRWDGEKPTTGIQAAARKARYSLMGTAMQEDGVRLLTTAHHLDDQAETVLMRLAHGSGIEGLRGMDTFAELGGGLMVCRPLLDIEPAELKARVATAGLTAIADPSNTDASYERVRWRQLMPQLAALGLDSRRLARFALRMRKANLAVDAMAESVDSGRIVDPVRSVTVADLSRAPTAVAERVVGSMLDEVGHGAKPHALAAVEALTRRLLREPVRVTLHDCLVRSDGERVTVSREPGRSAARKARGHVTAN